MADGAKRLAPWAKYYMGWKKSSKRSWVVLAQHKSSTHTIIISFPFCDSRTYKHGSVFDLIMPISVTINSLSSFCHRCADCFNPSSAWLSLMAVAMGVAVAVSAPRSQISVPGKFPESYIVSHSLADFQQNF